jgi:NLI interacting factor-like phosphatase
VTVKVLALDLERTLISDARSGVPRPGLYDFLTFCRARFDRVVIFTTVEEADARAVMEDLAQRGKVPDALLEELDYIASSGAYKDLTLIPWVVPDEVLLLDDDAGWIRPDQRSQWIAIEAWDGGPDHELSRIRAELERRLE